MLREVINHIEVLKRKFMNCTQVKDRGIIVWLFIRQVNLDMRQSFVRESCFLIFIAQITVFIDHTRNFAHLKDLSLI